MLENKIKAVIWVLLMPIFTLLIILCAIIEVDWKDSYKRLWDTARYLWEDKKNPVK